MLPDFGRGLVRHRPLGDAGTEACNEGLGRMTDGPARFKGQMQGAATADAS